MLDRDAGSKSPFEQEETRTRTKWSIFENDHHLCAVVTIQCLRNRRRLKRGFSWLYHSRLIHCWGLCSSEVLNVNVRRFYAFLNRCLLHIHDLDLFLVFLGSVLLKFMYTFYSWQLHWPWRLPLSSNLIMDSPVEICMNMESHQDMTCPISS